MEKEYTPSKACEELVDKLAESLLGREKETKEDSSLGDVFAEMFASVIIFATAATAVCAVDAALQGIDELPDVDVVE